MKNLLLVLILASAFLVGYLLAYLARDELIKGRKWFICISVVSILALIPVCMFYFTFAGILTLIFIAIISLMAVWKSYDAKFVK